MRFNTAVVIREVHPEVCLHPWNGGKSMLYAKKKREGHEERLALVRSYYDPDAFTTVRGRYARSVAADDDILDAFAALWTAERIIRGEARTLPENPSKDSLGLPMEMVY